MPKSSLPLPDMDVPVGPVMNPRSGNLAAYSGNQMSIGEYTPGDVPMGTGHTSHNLPYGRGPYDGGMPPGTKSRNFYRESHRVDKDGVETHTRTAYHSERPVYGGAGMSEYGGLIGRLWATTIGKGLICALAALVIWAGSHVIGVAHVCSVCGKATHSWHTMSVMSEANGFAFFAAMNEGRESNQKSEICDDCYTRVQNALLLMRQGYTLVPAD